MQMPAYVRQVGFSFVFKAVAVLASFLLVPVTLGYAGAERFGIWVTLYSVLSWTMFFDLGLANSLRNRTATCAANGDWAEARVAISSAYYAIGGAVAAVYAIFAFASLWIDWGRVFNASTVSSAEVWACMLVSAFLFLANFLLASVNQLFFATHQASRVVMGQMLSSLLCLAAVALLQRWQQPSLVLLAVFYGTSQLLGSLFLNAYFFRQYPHLLPEWSLVSRKEVAGLMGGGWQFFVIQLAVLAIFTTDKIVMAQLFSPQVVAGYEVVSRLFSAILIASGLFMAPLWSSYTHLWAKGDLEAVRRLLRKSHLVLMAMAVPAIVAYLLCSQLIVLWVGPSLNVSESLFLPVVAFVLLRIWCDIYAYFLNGTGMIQVQMWLAVLQCVLNVPLAVWLGRSFGPAGVVWASFITLSLSGIILPLHAYYVIRERRG